MLNKPKFSKSNDAIDVNYVTDNSDIKKIKVENEENIITLDSSTTSSGDSLGGLYLMRDCIICREPKIHVDDMHKDNQLICEDCLVKLRELICR